MRCPFWVIKSALTVNFVTLFQTRRGASRAPPSASTSAGDRRHSATRLTESRELTKRSQIVGTEISRTSHKILSIKTIREKYLDLRSYLDLEICTLIPDPSIHPAVLAELWRPSRGGILLGPPSDHRRVGMGDVFGGFQVHTRHRHSQSTVQTVYRVASYVVNK